MFLFLIIAICQHILICFGNLIYEDPVFAIQSPNFTLGGLFGISNPNGSVNTDGIDRAISMMCTLKEFNEGNGPFKVTGIFNGLVYDAGKTVTRSEYAAMRLLEYNLRDSQANPEEERIKVGAIIADLDTTVFFATQPVFSGFPFTFLGVQFLSSAIIGTNDSLLPRPVFKARIVPQSFVISASSSSTVAAAIVQLLLHFNWTLVTVLYSSDTFGMEGQAFLQPLLQENSILTTCSVITRTSNTTNSTNPLANCVNKSDSSVVIVWSGVDSRTLVEICRVIQSGTKKKIVFITPGSDTTTIVDSANLSTLSSSFLFKNFNLVPFTASFSQCLAEIKPETQKYFHPDLFKSYWEEKFKCSPSDSQCLTDSILSATTDINEVADSTMLILKAIYFIQNNCSTLNNLLNTYGINLQNKDYCAKTTFTAADIYQIVNLVLYLGLPNFLALGTDYSSDDSSSQSLSILQVDGKGQLVPVGNYLNSELKMNDSALYWSNNGTAPESEVSVDNPSLNDAIVDVFFSFTVLGILLSCFIKGFFIYHRKDRSLRKSSPWFSFLILLGLDFILVAFIFLGMTYTTTTCFLYAWLITIGCGMCLANIYVKNYRIYRIFKNPEAKALSISDKELFTFTSVVMFVEIVLLSIYSFSSGLLGPKVIQSSNDIYYKYRICRVPSDTVQIALTIIIYTFNMGILLCVAVLAFLTRHIDNSYSEARRVAYTIYSALLFQIIFLPLLYTAGDSTGGAMTRYCVTGIIVLCSSYLTMAFLFSDKIYQLTWKRENREISSIIQ